MEREYRKRISRRKIRKLIWIKRKADFFCPCGKT